MHYSCIVRIDDVTAFITMHDVNLAAESDAKPAVVCSVRISLYTQSGPSNLVRFHYAAVLIVRITRLARSSVRPSDTASVHLSHMEASVKGYHF